MGQYFRIVNLDRREWFGPGAFGETVKHPERDPLTMEALGQLLKPDGRWCGDRIAIVSDTGLTPIGTEARPSSVLYDDLNEPGWTDIAPTLEGANPES